MLSPLLLVAASGLVLAGLIFNGFIVKVIITEWIQGKALATKEQLLLSLSVSNFCCTVLAPVSNFMEHGAFNRIPYFLYTFAILCRFWISAWLCVFCCIKIVNCTHTLFFWCRQRMQRLIPWLLVGSTLIALLASIPIFWNISIPLQSNTTDQVSYIPQQLVTFKPTVHYCILLLVIGTVSPLVVVLLCSLLIVVSLCRHIGCITRKESNVSHLQVDGHIKAAGTVLCLLCLYLSISITDILLTFDVTSKKATVKLSHLLFTLAYAPIQAVNLMLVNPKLKQAAIQVLSGRRP